MLRGKDLLIVVLQRVSFKSKTSLDLIRRSVIKYHPNSLRLLMIRCLNQDTKSQGVGTQQMRSLHVPSVERVTVLNAWLERAIVLVVARVVRRLGISLM